MNTQSGGQGAPHARACANVRSTLLVGSVKALRERGHGDRYKQALDVKFHDLIFRIGAPTWLPLEVAQAHYGACDVLALSTDEILCIGALVAPVHVSGVDLVLRAARAGGVTPWTVLNNGRRYWARMYDGSEITITEKGPKDARILIEGQPLARSRYWRVGLRGIVLSITTALSTKAYAKELPSQGPDQVAYALAWV